MMRSMKKSKDTESRNQPVVASVSKLICTTKGQSSTLNGEYIDHTVTWRTGVFAWTLLVL